MLRQEQALLEASLACVLPQDAPRAGGEKMHSSWLSEYDSASPNCSCSSSLVDAAKGAVSDIDDDERTLLAASLARVRLQRTPRGGGKKLQSSWLSDYDSASPLRSRSCSLVDAAKGAANASDGDVLLAPAACDDDDDDDGDNDDGTSHDVFSDILCLEYVASLNIALGPTSPTTSLLCL